MSRKRKRTENGSCQPRKLPKLLNPTKATNLLQPCAANANASTTPSSLLALYYPTVLSLKDFFLARLPVTSRIRRKRIEALASENPRSLLNTTLVGILTDPVPAIHHTRVADFVAFTQSQRLSNLNDTAKSQTCSIHDILDFVIRKVFDGASLAFSRPRHLLCNGLQRASAAADKTVTNQQPSHLPGLIQVHPNDNLNTLKTPPWADLLGLLGAAADSIFLSLLLDCGLFTSLSNGNKNYFQLSGTPFVDLKITSGPLPIQRTDGTGSILRRPTDIKFIRNRILYAKSSLNGKGQVHFGLKHVHVLQRYHRHQDESETVHVLKHVFPRQFGLHNAFSSPVSPKDTAQPLPDYVYREDEINKENKHPSHWLPKRLRWSAALLIRRLRRNHARCSYSQLLRHYCPLSPLEIAVPPAQYGSRPARGIASTPLVTQPRSSAIDDVLLSDTCTDQASGSSYIPFTTPTACVAAFCKSVIVRLLPCNALGSGLHRLQNQRNLLQSVERFVHLRRFETMCLQEVTQGLKLKSIHWLALPNMKTPQSLSRAESAKRTELFHEFIYYVFDSLIIPLIRSNFYVTESAPFRNQLLYFRHDVWRKLTAPSLAMLRLDLYQPLKPPEVRKALSGRSLGYSHVRLLPKAEGVRTITNLKRKMIKSINGRRALGPSINVQLGPVFGALNYERCRTPHLLGSALFSVNGLHERLRDFKATLPQGAQLYFVKVDVQACFDTIPQDRLLELVDKLMSSLCYKMTRYAEVKLAEKSIGRRQKYVNIAQPADLGAAFTESSAERFVKSKEGVVLTEIGNARDWQRSHLIRLLQDHVQNNIVKVGKKHLRQKNGIPQGSVLSSILCNYFYAAFESEYLQFLDAKNSLLLRLIDDFLLITTDGSAAQHFAETMMCHHPAYGISTNAEKSLTNFDMRIGSRNLPRHHGRSGFPYCGTRIDVSSLEITKDRDAKNSRVSQGLTIDTTRSAGSTFQRKMLLAFKIQIQAMLVDAALNSRQRVIATLMEMFSDTAMKIHSYIKGMQTSQRPSARIVISVIEDLVKYVARYVESKCHATLQPNNRNRITRKQICWMAAASIEQRFVRKQSQQQDVLIWLRSLRLSSEASMGMNRKALSQMKADCDEIFKDYIY